MRLCNLPASIQDGRFFVPWRITLIQGEILRSVGLSGIALKKKSLTLARAGEMANLEYP
jgi:hypothetical protein